MIPSHAPFSSEQSASLSALVSGFSPEQSTWLSGFLAGLSPELVAAPSNLTVVYGTESGNCEELADRTVKAAKKKGVKAVMKNLADLSPSDFAKFENFGGTESLPKPLKVSTILLLTSLRISKGTASRYARWETLPTTSIAKLGKSSMHAWNLLARSESPREKTAMSISRIHTLRGLAVCWIRWRQAPR